MQVKERHDDIDADRTAGPDDPGDRGSGMAGLVECSPDLGRDSRDALRRRLCPEHKQSMQSKEAMMEML
jgi:hypothetical protein